MSPAAFPQEGAVHLQSPGQPLIRCDIDWRNGEGWIAAACVASGAYARPPFRAIVPGSVLGKKVYALKHEEKGEDSRSKMPGLTSVTQSGQRKQGQDKH